MKSSKICSKCGISKPLDEFYNQKDGKCGKRADCKECFSKSKKIHYIEHKDEYSKKSKKHYRENKEKISKDSRKRYIKNREKIKRKSRERYQKHHEEIRERERLRKGQLPMNENKFCSSYLGVVIAERLCRHLFKDVEMMSYGNTGFDIICNKGKKIDVKSSCIRSNTNKNPRWGFHIENNTTADFFILVAFDNRTDLNPLHMWMNPGKEINNQGSVSTTLSRIHKWSQWERDINDAQLCCNELKDATHER